ncbi:MAG: WG repeat-containing protein, partial [Bacteroidota bacterium]
LQSFAQQEITAEPPEEVIATPDLAGDEMPVMEISPDWEQLILEQRKTAVVKYQENGLFGLKRGDQILTPAIYSWLDVPSSMYGPTCWAKRNGKYGILSRDGREVIPCEFDETVDALEFGDRSLYKVVKDGKSGVMDTNQVLRIPIVYTSLYSSREGLYCFRDNKAGFFNTKLEEV